MRYIDLRSDTVTQPTSAMREAMAKAPVGDDVFGDDPTMNELEALAAETLGKEAALFVPSGMQGNLISIMAHTRRGDAIILGRGSHIASHEAGNYAMLAGVSPVFAEDDDEVLRPDSVAALIRDDRDLQVAPTGLICLEDALSNGNVAPAGNLAAIYGIAKEHGLPVHLDGARLYNAAASLGVGVKELTGYCDSVMCCLSKGLCAPVGSIVAGGRDFIARARKLRRLLGGGMRQAGILAAAGKLALTEMAGRLAEDHENARYLASLLDGLPGITVKRNLVKVNIIFFLADWPREVMDAYPAAMLERGIKVTPGSGEFRMVTNRGVNREDCEAVARALKDFLAGAYKA